MHVNCLVMMSQAPVSTDSCACLPHAFQVRKARFDTHFIAFCAGQQVTHGSTVGTAKVEVRRQAIAPASKHCVQLPAFAFTLMLKPPATGTITQPASLMLAKTAPMCLRPSYCSFVTPLVTAWRVPWPKIAQRFQPLSGSSPGAIPNARRQQNLRWIKT